ncbi:MULTISPECIES: helix-turn-helix domain-containing protein [Exiguobacterium]|uniref:helix-turn-helix domain-containing protein n=1 Tax=Exiguobacterium TaxID=33986 RepID=UPI001BE57476|nr:MULTISPECIES: helix-turn-helix transcriptional regulator [Exiguobacterium]MCA0981189.1 helix-turn-helix transcriptional regulator [Exiguobacterium aestuarii]
MNTFGTHPGSLIRERRKALNMTQSVLAEKTGIHRSSIIRVEKGDPINQEDWFEKIGRTLKYSPEKLKNNYESYFQKSSLEFTPLSYSFDDSLNFMNEESKNNWISEFINRNDGDYEIFSERQSMLSKYRNGRVLIERFQVAIHLLTSALVHSDVQYKIKKIRYSSFDVSSSINSWKKQKNDPNITFKSMIENYNLILEDTEKNYSLFLKELLKKASNHYWLASNLSHPYEIGKQPAKLIEEYAVERLYNFTEDVYRMYVATDFIMNVLNKVSIYELIEEKKISDYLKTMHPEQLFE